MPLLVHQTAAVVVGWTSIAGSCFVFPVPLVRHTRSADTIIVATNNNLFRNIVSTFLPFSQRKTYHSKAPNTTAASLALQTPQCLAHPISPSKAARAIKPANQNIRVRDSAARIPNLCAAMGTCVGAITR